MKKPINIVLVSLNDKFCKTVGQSLAESLDMFNADCEEMIIYNLTNPKEVIETCGFEYFKKRERSVVLNCSEYENTVITINYDLLKSYLHLFTNSLTIYIQLPQEKVAKVPNVLDYETRNEFLTENTDISVWMEQKSVKKCTNLIISKLGEFYENC